MFTAVWHSGAQFLLMICVSCFFLPPLVFLVRKFKLLTGEDWRQRRRRNGQRKGGVECRVWDLSSSADLMPRADPFQ